MNILKDSILILLLIAPFVGVSQINPTFNSIPASFNINSPNPVYALDINYDNIDVNQQAFHLFLPDTTGVYPLVIFIHGGGFQSGSRDIVMSNPELITSIKYFLERDIAFASIGYRLLSSSGPPDNEGVIKCLEDSKYALQFIRYYSSDLFLNPNKIALKGKSAGAGTSLWLATRSDMANPNSLDPVLHSSTRVCAVEVNNPQSTYDFYKWETEVFNNFDGQGSNYTANSMSDLLGFDRYNSFYGGTVDSVYDILYDPALIQYRQDVDMLFHMTSDDAAIYLTNTIADVHPSDNVLHHPLHAKVLNDYALSVNISEIKTTVAALGINTTQGESPDEFLERQLNSCAQITGIVHNTTNNDFDIYPNPANSQITINTGTIEIITDIKVFSISGKLILEKHNIISETISIPTHNWNTGIYIVQITNGMGIQRNNKLIIQ